MNTHYRRRFEYRVIATLVLIIGITGVGCVADEGESRPSGSTGSDSPAAAQVMASTPIWADVVESVTCDRIPVESIAPPGSDSHDFELSMRGADRLLGSRLVFANGLGLETDLAPMFERAEASNVTVVDLGGQLSADHSPIEGDPHIWTAPENVMALVPVIEEEIASLDLMDRDQLADCAARYVGQLEELSEVMTRTLSVVEPAHRKLVGVHRNLGYFARQFDFDVLGTMIDSSSSLAEADTRHLDSLRAEMRDAGVDAVVIDAADSDSAASAFIKDVSPTGRVVKIYIETMPTGDGADGYLGMMRLNAERVATALSE